MNDGRAVRQVWFTINGERYELRRDVVERRLVGMVPGSIRKHAVRVNGTWFPVKEAFEAATGIPRGEFISHTAIRHMADLGFEIHGQIDQRPTSSAAGLEPRSRPRTPHVDSEHRDDEGWHTEANVQAAVVAALVARDWRILSVANTATREHGIDIIAQSAVVTAGIEVKGFPSRAYADPARAHEVKRTSPSTQAVHWYAQAALAAMRLRGKEPNWLSAIALPAFPRYEHLYDETRDALRAARIQVWWVGPEGELSGLS